MEEKQVYENQETAIKLLEENVELKKRIQQAIDYMKIFTDFDMCTINGKSFQKAIDILEGDKNE